MQRNKEDVLNHLEIVGKSFLEIIGETNREGLVDTPKRFAKGYFEMLSGYRQEGDAYLSEIFSKTFSTDNNSMVVMTDIPVQSFCEHHVVPFFGTCNIGYVPKNKVVGLSKLVRVVDHFSRRLQIQEQLTEQIASTINNRLDCSGVIVTMKCIHLCMLYRGVKAQAYTTTSKVLGIFETSAVARQEFLSISSSSQVSK